MNGEMRTQAYGAAGYDFAAREMNPAIMGACLIAGLYLFLYPGDAWAFTAAGRVREGNRLYSSGQYEDAASVYEEALKRQSESDIIHFNTGAAYYQSGDFEKALDHFQKALLSNDEDIRQRAHYNLGNTAYRLAEGAGPRDPAAAVPFLERSLGHYEQALSLSEKDEDARYNYEFVKRVLEEVKKQIEQQKEQCANSKKDSGDQDDSDQDREGSEQKKEPGAPQDQESLRDQESSQDQESVREQEEGDRDGAPDEEQRDGGGQMTPGQQEDRESGGQSQDERDLSEREARMRLMDYQRNDEPQGMLNLRGPFDRAPVEKDW